MDVVILVSMCINIKFYRQIVTFIDFCFKQTKKTWELWIIISSLNVLGCKYVILEKKKQRQLAAATFTRKNRIFFNNIMPMGTKNLLHWLQNYIYILETITFLTFNMNKKMDNFDYLESIIQSYTYIYCLS